MKLYNQYTILSLATLVGISLSVFLGFVLYDNETTTINQHFKSDVDDKAASFEREILLNLETLYSVKGLFDASYQVDSGEFRYLSNSILSRHKNIESIAWVPSVPENLRLTVEAERREDYTDFEITEQLDKQELISASQREIYYPVYYIEPLMGKESILGFDMGSLADRAAVLNKSRDSGKLLIANNFKSFTNPSKRSLYIIFPVFFDQPTTVEKRREKLRGFIVNVYDTKALFSSAIQRTAAVGLNLSLVDVTDSNTDVLYTSNLTNRFGASLEPEYFYKKQLFEFGGRSWYIGASPTVNYVAERRTVLPMTASLFSSLTVILMAFYTFRTMQHSGVVENTVNERTRELYEAKKILEALSRTDSLTDIGNRRFFDEYLETEWNRAYREQIPLSLVMIDIDHFKLFNDTYGHTVGDECLKSVAYTLKNSLKRTSDLVTRYGGEEFVIILPNTEDAFILAETCRENIEALKIPHSESKTSKYLTVSIGIATMTPKEGSTISGFLNIADSHLYAAKENGRNRVIGQAGVLEPENFIEAIRA